MKKYLFSFMFSVPCLWSFGNSFSLDWVRSPDDYLRSGAMLARDNADNVISTGYTRNASIFTRKYDKFGNLLWERSSSSDVHANYEKSIWVNTDSQRNVYVTGYRYTISTQPPFEFPNAIVVLKYDPAGNLLWKFVLPGSFSLNRPFSNTLIRIRSEIDADGNLYTGTSGIIAGNQVEGFILVKINPQGNMVWNRTHNFSEQHGFLSMRLRNNLIVLTGSSAPNYQDVSSVMYDTSGNEKWSATTFGYGGQDAELDNAGNAYVLTWNFDEAAPGSGADIVVIKYSTTGSQLARRNYDLGGDEFTRRMVRTGTNELGIIGYAVREGSVFTSWMVVKINMNGAVQWSKIHTNPGPYDEYPYNLAGNSKGELFVTGARQNGKPFPGYHAVTTNKYLPGGATAWSAQYDSTAAKGLAIALAGDGSLYVLGESVETVIHYFDHTGTGSCKTPDTIAAGNIKPNSAVIGYPKTQGAFAYHIQYKVSTSPVWIIISTGKPRYTLTGLTPGTTYDFRVEAVCNSGPSGYSVTKQFTTTGTGYCSTGGLDASDDWIDLVWIGAIRNETQSNNGYADFSYMNANVARGATVTGYLSAGYELSNFPVEYFRVWVDYNIDGDFNDPGEQVFSASTTSLGWIYVEFVVPLNATVGTTRMRVSMKRGSYPPPCGAYTLGEAEDYSLVIGTQAPAPGIYVDNAPGNYRDITRLSAKKYK